MIDLATSTYYYKPKISRLDREKEDADIADKIEYLQVHFSCWGYRTITAQLKTQYQMIINKKKVLRIMRKYHLFKRQKRRFCITTDSDHNYRIYPNLIKGLKITALNQLWAADITYIRIETGFVFLACILDVYSRMVVGYALAKKISHELTCAALQHALEERKPGSGLIHHSDRGVQYACTEYIKLLKDYGDIKISMSAKGNPYHNAFAESFFKTLKQEEVYMWDYQTFTDVIDRIPQFIDEVYNKKRVHSSLKYLTPFQFECMIQQGKIKDQVTLISDCKQSK